MNCPVFPPKLCRAYQLSAQALQDVVLSGLRLYIAWVFFSSGLTKIQDWNTTLALFQYEYSVPFLTPALAALMGTCGELLLPPLLALGLATRFSAAGLFVVNAMAMLSYPALWGFDCPAALQSHFFWGAALLVLIANGGGRVSLDKLMCRYYSCSTKSAGPT